MIGSTVAIVFGSLVWPWYGSARMLEDQAAALRAAVGLQRRWAEHLEDGGLRSFHQEQQHAARQIAHEQAAAAAAEATRQKPRQYKRLLLYCLLPALPRCRMHAEVASAAAEQRAAVTEGWLESVKEDIQVGVG